MDKKICSKSFSLLLIVSAIVLLPGCDWFGKKEEKQAAPAGASAKEPFSTVASDDTSEVLVTMEDGSPLITVRMFEDEFENYLEKNQQARALMALMPNMEEQFLNGLTNLKIVELYVVKKDLDKTPEFKEDLRESIRAATQMVNAKYFAKDHPVSVTDNEVKKFYDENKMSMPEIIVSRGGVATVGVVFDDEARAKEFYEKVKGKSKEFDKMVKEANIEGLKRDFNLVNEQSVGMEPALRDKIMGAKKFPTVDMLKVDDKTYWVYNSTKKEEPKYRSFDEIKAGLKEYMSRDKQAQKIQKVLDDLRQEYAITINKEYFEKKKAEAQKKAEADTPKKAVDLAEVLKKQTPEKTKKTAKTPTQKAAPVTQAV